MILDFLAILDGGPLLNQVAPHLLSAIFWFTLSICFCMLTAGRRNNADPVLCAGFNVLFVTGLRTTVSSLLLVENYSQPIHTQVTTIWSSLEFFAGISGRLLISAAFLQIVIGQREQTIDFLKVSVAVIAVAIVFAQTPHWLLLMGNDKLASPLESAYVPLFTQVVLSALFGYAVYKSLGSVRKIAGQSSLL